MSSRLVGGDAVAASSKFDGNAAPLYKVVGQGDEANPASTEDKGDQAASPDSVADGQKDGKKKSRVERLIARGRDPAEGYLNACQCSRRERPHPLLVCFCTACVLYNYERFDNKDFYFFVGLQGALYTVSTIESLIEAKAWEDYLQTQRNLPPAVMQEVQAADEDRTGEKPSVAAAGIPQPGGFSELHNHYVPAHYDNVLHHSLGAGSEEFNVAELHNEHHHMHYHSGAKDRHHYSGANHNSDANHNGFSELGPAPTGLNLDLAPPPTPGFSEVHHAYPRSIVHGYRSTAGTGRKPDSNKTVKTSGGNPSPSSTLMELGGSSRTSSASSRSSPSSSLRSGINSHSKESLSTLKLPHGDSENGKKRISDTSGYNNPASSFARLSTGWSAMQNWRDIGNRVVLQQTSFTQISEAGESSAMGDHHYHLPGVIGHNHRLTKHQHYPDLMQQPQRELTTGKNRPRDESQTTEEKGDNTIEKHDPNHQHHQLKHRMMEKQDHQSSRKPQPFEGTSNLQTSESKTSISRAAVEAPVDDGAAAAATNGKPDNDVPVGETTPSKDSGDSNVKDGIDGNAPQSTCLEETDQTLFTAGPVKPTDERIDKMYHACEKRTARATDICQPSGECQPDPCGWVDPPKLREYKILTNAERGISSSADKASTSVVCDAVLGSEQALAKTLKSFTGFDVPLAKEIELPLSFWIIHTIREILIVCFGVAAIWMAATYVPPLYGQRPGDQGYVNQLKASDEVAVLGQPVEGVDRANVDGGVNAGGGANVHAKTAGRAGGNVEIEHNTNVEGEHNRAPGRNSRATNTGRDFQPEFQHPMSLSSRYDSLEGQHSIQHYIGPVMNLSSSSSSGKTGFVVQHIQNVQNVQKNSNNSPKRNSGVGNNLAGNLSSNEGSSSSSKFESNRVHMMGSFSAKRPMSNGGYGSTGTVYGSNNTTSGSNQVSTNRGIRNGVEIRREEQGIKGGRVQSDVQQVERNIDYSRERNIDNDREREQRIRQYTKSIMSNNIPSRNNAGHGPWHGGAAGNNSPSRGGTTGGSRSSKIFNRNGVMYRGSVLARNGSNSQSQNPMLFYPDYPEEDSDEDSVMYDGEKGLRKIYDGQENVCDGQEKLRRVSGSRDGEDETLSDALSCSDVRIKSSDEKSSNRRDRVHTDGKNSNHSEAGRNREPLKNLSKTYGTLCGERIHGGDRFNLDVERYNPEVERFNIYTDEASKEETSKEETPSEGVYW